jgi:hypothetical protein
MAKDRKKPTTHQLEEKFARTAFRLSQERNDFLLPQILDFVSKQRWLNIHPEYQRRLVWDVGKKSRFIESLLLNIPIPPLYLYEWELGRYEVMDGQQRLNAVLEFYDNAFALHGLEKWTELDGLRCRDLPDTLRRGLDRRRLSATVLLFEGRSSDQVEQGDVRKIVFERLNTGGQNLNAQEIRNCLFAGSFNDLLIRLAQKKLFTDIWDIPSYQDHIDQDGRPSAERAEDRLYRRMIDCEIVLRFFAFRKRSRIKGSVRRILDNCMKDHQNAPPDEIATMAWDFESRLEVAHDVFGDRTFRYKEADRSWKLSQPLCDAVMVALDRLWSQKDKVRKRKTAVGKAVTKLFSDDDAYAIIVGRPNTAKAIRARIDLLTSTVTQASRL